jgi:hypothetical protein
MVLDPLTALSVAGNIVQFVDFSTKVLRQGYLLYKSSSGTLEVNDELKLLTDDILKLSTKLEQPVRLVQLDRPSVGHEPELEVLCNGCQEIAKDLLHRLERLKVEGRHKVWDSLWHAVQTAWSEGRLRR